jgi:hypothetical protein
MASDNTSSTAGTGTAHAGADSTQPLAPVDAGAAGAATSDAATPAKGTNAKAPGPSTNGTAKGKPEGAAQPVAAAGTTKVATVRPASADDGSSSASSVKDGAVKAAAAALAAARTAAKKVQSAGSTASAGATTGAQASSSTPPPGEAAESAPRPQMHYAAGGVHGTAQPEPQAPAPDSPAHVEEPALGSPRRVRLSVSRIDPWSIMKLAFLLSVAIGIMTVVATIVVWYSLNSLGTFATIQEFMVETLGPQAVNLTQFVEFERMVSLATLIALVNIVLLTAIATIMTMLYNITAALVGGIHLTLTDE